MAIQYDPEVLQVFADRLYRRASTIVVACALCGGVLCGGLAFLVGINTKPNREFWLPAVIIGALLGLAIGLRKSFDLKLEAQRTLCQMHIADNTRVAAELLYNISKFEAARSRSASTSD